MSSTSLRINSPKHPGKTPPKIQAYSQATKTASDTSTSNSKMSTADSFLFCC